LKTEINDIANFSKKYIRWYKKKRKHSKEFMDEDIKISEEASQILKRLTNNPISMMGLRGCKCSHCAAEFYIEADMKIKKVGLLDQIYCPFCGLVNIEDN